jgi:hypothetical protein
VRIVDRATFLTLPAGTVYAKWEPCCFGTLNIKCDMRGDTDWYSIELNDCIDVGNGEPIDALDRLNDGNEVGVDLDYEYNDGMYDLDQRFAIWSAADVDALIARLQRAKADAYARDDTAQCDHVRDGIRVVQVAYDLNPSNGIDTVLRWYRTHRIKELDGKTSKELVAAGRVDDVLAYLKSLEG